MKTRTELMSESRYAIRLTQRTARLYRRIQTSGVFLSILGGSAALVTVTGGVPLWLTACGGVLLAVSGAALVAIRPADKAALNEADTRRYTALIAKAHAMTDQEFAAAIDEAHQSDAQEVEPLRAVAYNDIALELNRPDVVIPLNTVQKLLATLA